ncbi:hypothetical protein PENSPDRAFT_753096 [Peniophora sp. CONT]|nr:hypothetical protein PENSPDRAFT_753096 [Peniophora sp. CONT]
MADLRYFAAYAGRDSNASASSSGSGPGQPQQTRVRDASPHRPPRSGATLPTILPARGREAMDLLADVAASDRGASWHRMPLAAPSRHRRMMETVSPLSPVDAYDSAFPHASPPKTPSDDDDLLSDEASDRHSSASPFSTPYGSYESPATNYKPSSHLGNFINPKLRRYSSATDDALNGEGREASSSAEPDVIHVQFPVTVGGSGIAAGNGTGKRRRHVPDTMQAIACYFCRRRKIKCGTPQGDEKCCPPCAKRQLPCEYAEKSNRGMRTDLMRRKQETHGEPYRNGSDDSSSSSSPTPPSMPAPVPSHASHATTTRLPPVSALTGGNTFAYPYFPARPQPPSPLPRLSEIVRPPAYTAPSYLSEKYPAQAYYSEPRFHSTASVPRPHRYPTMHLSGPAVHPLPH